MQRRIILAVIVLSTAVPVPAVAAAGPELAFRQSGLEGGGFVNVVAVDPFDPAVVLAGGDVSGLHRSTDGGTTWRTSNAGLTNPNQLSVAALAFSPTTPGLVYAAVGVRGTGGGVLASTDGGITWTQRSSLRFSGSNNQGIVGIPPGHPRATGRLLVVDPSGLLYAATLDQGVLRSADGGVTWTSIGLAGRFLRGLAFDPAAPDVLFAAAYNAGVFRTGDARGSGGFTALAGAPTQPEELAISGGTLYVAAGIAGIFAAPVTGGAWSLLGGGSVPRGPVWISIAVYRACNRDVVYVGATGGGPNAVVRSLDGGASWTSLADDPTTITTAIGGPGGPPWWLASQAHNMFGGGSYVAAAIAAAGAPGAGCLVPRVLVAGRSGLWGSSDAGDRWAPMVAGLGVSIARDAAVDPRTPGRAYVATADWVFHHSVDGLATVGHRKPPGGTTAPDIAIDAAVPLGRVYVASGNPSSNTLGEVFSSPNPVTTGWTDEGLSSTGANGKRPLAIASRTVAGQRILIAAVSGGGVWRKAGSAWTKVQSTAMGRTQPTRGSSIAWAEGSPTVFLFDRETGVWRSNDNGRTWTKIWTIRSSIVGTGYVSVDPTSQGRLFVSVGALGVFRIEGATAGSVDAGTLTAVEVGGFAAPGPITHDASGVIFATETAAPGVVPQLRRSADAGATWQVISDDMYSATALWPFAIVAGPGGTVTVATNGDGVIVGTPV